MKKDVSFITELIDSREFFSPWIKSGMRFPYIPEYFPESRHTLVKGGASWHSLTWQSHFLCSMEEFPFCASGAHLLGWAQAQEHPGEMIQQVCSEADEHHPRQSAGSSGIGRWGGTGRSCGRGTVVRIYCIKNVFSIKDKTINSFEIHSTSQNLISTSTADML